MITVTFLVEDNTTIRDDLVPALAELAGIEVVATATDLTEARDIFEAAADWHLAIVDVFLKDGNGLNVLRLLRQRQQHQLVIALSSSLIPDIRQRCMALGANAVFDRATEVDALVEYLQVLNK